MDCYSEFLCIQDNEKALADAIFLFTVLGLYVLLSIPMYSSNIFVEMSVMSDEQI